LSADTSADVEQRYARMIMSLSPQRRVAMCAEMSETARGLVRRSLEQAGLTGSRLSDAFVARLYGGDLSPSALAACQACIRDRLLP
jgi:hypothetical protein